jgi:hypothetical protein
MSIMMIWAGSGMARCDGVHHCIYWCGWLAGLLVMLGIEAMNTILLLWLWITCHVSVR